MKKIQLMFISLMVFIGVAFSSSQPAQVQFVSLPSSAINGFNSKNQNAPADGQMLAPSIQDEIDDLLEAYNAALQFELENGETVVVEDELGEKTVMLAGESAAKIEALWQETINKINQLSARPAEERMAAIELVRSISGSEDVVYLDRDRSLYNGHSLERYSASNYIYSVDIESNQIAEISLINQVDINFDTVYSQVELEESAIEFISSVLPTEDLTALTSSVADKEGIVFAFRWESGSKFLDSEMFSFIQVTYSTSGDLLHFVNTLSQQGSILQ